MHHGIVKSFRKNHHQDIDGVLLEDGTDVRFPPHIGRQVKVAIKIGDAIKIDGQTKTKPRAEIVLEARRIQTRNEVIEIPRPKAHHPKPTHSSGEAMNANGRLVEFHFNRHGELDGFRLDDETEVKFPPHLGSSLERCVAVGDTVLAEGRRHETPKGDIHLHADRITNQKTNASVNRHDTGDAEGDADSLPSTADIMQELKEIRSILEKFTKSKLKPKAVRTK